MYIYRNSRRRTSLDFSVNKNNKNNKNSKKVTLLMKVFVSTEHSKKKNQNQKII